MTETTFEEWFSTFWGVWGYRSPVERAEPQYNEYDLEAAFEGGKRAAAKMMLNALEPYAE